MYQTSFDLDQITNDNILFIHRNGLGNLKLIFERTLFENLDEFEKQNNCIVAMNRNYMTVFYRIFPVVFKDEQYKSVFLLENSDFVKMVNGLRVSKGYQGPRNKEFPDLPSYMYYKYGAVFKHIKGESVKSGYYFNSMKNLVLFMHNHIGSIEQYLHYTSSNSEL